MISFIQHTKYPGHQQNDFFFDTLSSLSRFRSFRHNITHLFTLSTGPDILNFELDQSRCRTPSTG